ncbi:MAG: LD-carboxypeptidase [Bdellovibrionota bacterium]
MKYFPWQPLKEGDIVDVIAPGSATDRASLERVKKFLASWGLKARVPKDILKPYMFHASPDEIRQTHLLNALRAKDSKAVWCLRGGYGSIRLLPELSRINKVKPKLFIGLSDISSLHLLMNDEWNWATVHGPVLDRAARGDLSPSQIKELRGLVFGQQKQIQFKNIKAVNESAKKVRRLKAPIIGGNMVTLQSTFGTKFQPSLRNRLIFLEEIGERAYRIDRILEHLRQIPDFKFSSGVLFGTFTDCKEPDGKNLIPATIKRFAAGTTVPVFTGIVAGHDPKQRCLPFMTPATILRKQSNFEITVDAGFSL